MRNIRRILVAVKHPQAKSIPSVAKAAQLARAWDAEIELFHDLDSPLYLGTAGIAGAGGRGLGLELKARSLSRLEAIADRIRKRGVRVTTAVEWDYPVAEAIVRRARRWGADLIVAECRPGHHIAPVLLRLTDWELLRFSPVPVLLVKGPGLYRRPAILAAIDPMHAHAKPAGLDGEILLAGQAFRSALRGTLHAVHAWAPQAAGMTPQDFVSAQVAAGLQERARMEAKTGFDRTLRGSGIPRARRHLVRQFPQDAIVSVARATQSAIVVMGAISRRGIKRLLIGNTAERLLDEIPCDVLVVKPRELAAHVPVAKRGVRVLAQQPPLIFG